MEEWKIGNYKFRTKEGYMAGLQDKRKIAELKGKGVNIQDPDMAKRLYENLVASKYFRTQVGGDFLRILRVNAGIEEEKREYKKRSNRLNGHILLLGACITILVLLVLHLSYLPVEKKIEKTTISFVEAFYKDHNSKKAQTYMTTKYAKEKKKSMTEILPYIKDITYEGVTQFRILSSNRTSAKVQMILNMKEKDKKDEFHCELSLRKISGEWKISYLDCKNKKER